MRAPRSHTTEVDGGCGRIVAVFGRSLGFRMNIPGKSLERGRLSELRNASNWKTLSTWESQTCPGLWVDIAPNIVTTLRDYFFFWVPPPSCFALSTCKSCFVYALDFCRLFQGSRSNIHRIGIAEVPSRLFGLHIESPKNTSKGQPNNQQQKDSKRRCQQDIKQLECPIAIFTCIYIYIYIYI